MTPRQATSNPPEPEETGSGTRDPHGPQQAPGGPLRHSFRALQHRNFRLFIGGQIVSLSGSWMQQVALGWLVYRLTRSPFLLGLVGFAGHFPAVFVAPMAGVWADRWSRHRMVIVTQTLGMLQALVLAALVLSDQVVIWHILVLAAALGLVTGMDIPARQSFLIEMVAGKRDLANAIALNSSSFNLARLAGPSLAGLLIVLVGEGMVFLINGLSYFAVLLALLAMRLDPRPPKAGPVPPFWRHFAEGVRYAFGFAPIRAILLLMGLVSLAGFPFVVLLPVFATDLLRGGPHTLGFLVAAQGAGALAGALYLAARRTLQGLGSLIVRAVTLFGLGLMAFALARHVGLALGLLFLAGFGMMVQLASCNTILQTVLEDGKRGRVMSLYSMSFLGMMPLGSLLFGALAGRFGATATVAVGGLVCCFGAAAFSSQLPHIDDRCQVSEDSA
jgi:MFS family permease